MLQNMKWHFKSPLRRLTGGWNYNDPFQTYFQTENFSLELMLKFKELFNCEFLIHIRAKEVCCQCWIHTLQLKAFIITKHYNATVRTTTGAAKYITIKFVSMHCSCIFSSVINTVPTALIIQVLTENSWSKKIKNQRGKTLKIHITSFKIMYPSRRLPYQKRSSDRYPFESHYYILFNVFN